MGMKDWAKREVEIASAKERGNMPADEFDYGCACYDSALKAFNSLCEEYNHSGASIRFTKFILDRLIDGKPLTPIEDVPEVWNDIADVSGGGIKYQCNRMPSLFKEVFPDGHIEYDDVDQCYCEDINAGSTYTCELESNIIQELYPITMPYIPGDRIKVITEECLAYKKNGDFDTKAIFCCIKDGEKIEINRFFAEAQDYPDRKEVSVGHGLVEITYEEYVGRKVIAGALRKEIILKQCEMNCAAFENCSYKEEHSENYDWECDKEGSVNT
ncbi:MAG TPA: hypothetical protein PLK68_12320 [Thomasclavelia ramosa]|nr:hypothetical protein [Thomasclavelia ramosa]